MTNVIVTGSDGFIGKHLVKYLEKKGDNVVEISDSDMLPEYPEVREQIYALGGMNGTDMFYKKPFTVNSVNYLAALEACEYAEWIKRNGHNPRLLYTGSPEVYASSTDLHIAPIPTPEDVPSCIGDITNPRWSYAAAKIAAEALVIGARVQYGIDAIVCRPHSVYGAGDPNDHVVPSFFRQAQEGKIKAMGWDQTRSFTYIEDCCSAMYTIMNSDFHEPIINIGNDEETLIVGLAEYIAEIVDPKCEIERIDAPKGSAMRRLPDISKLRGLGWDPKYPLKKGLQAMWRDMWRDDVCRKLT